MNEQKQKNRQLMRKSTGIIFLGLAIMGAMTMYIIRSQPTYREGLDREKPVNRATNIHLTVLEKKSGAELNPISDKLHSGVKLAFNLSTNVPVHVALLASIDNTAPEILFENAKIPPGENRRLEKGGDRYIYLTQPAQRRIKFCLVQGSNSRALSRKLSSLANTWLQIPKTQCVGVLMNS